MQTTEATPAAGRSPEPIAENGAANNFNNLGNVPVMVDAGGCGYKGNKSKTKHVKTYDMTNV